MSDILTYNEASPEIRHLAAADARLARVIAAIGGIEFSAREDMFVFLANTIISQMLSNRVAEVLSGRLLALCAGELTPETVKNLSVSGVRSVGLSQRKASAIISLAESYIEDPGFFESLRDATDDGVISRLTSLPGIGLWSAKMFLIFVLLREDVLPLEDGAFLQAYKWLYRTNETTPLAVQMKCKPWRPYSSLAARYLYRLLDEGYTKKDAAVFPGTE